MIKNISIIVIIALVFSSCSTSKSTSASTSEKTTNNAKTVTTETKPRLVKSTATIRALDARSKQATKIRKVGLSKTK